MLHSFVAVFLSLTHRKTCKALLIDVFMNMSCRQVDEHAGIDRMFVFILNLHCFPGVCAQSLSNSHTLSRVSLSNDETCADICMCRLCLPSVLPIKWSTIVFFSLRTFRHASVNVGLSRQAQQSAGIFTWDRDRRWASSLFPSVCSSYWKPIGHHVLCMAVFSVECCCFSRSHLDHCYHPPLQQPPWGTST